MLRLPAFLMVFFILSGCSDRLLGRSDEAAPVWASKVRFEKDGRRFFTGRHDGSHYLEWGRNEARLAALRQVATELGLELTEPLVTVHLTAGSEDYVGVKMLDAEGEPVLIHHYREEQEYHEHWRRKGKKLYDVVVLISFPLESLEK